MPDLTALTSDALIETCIANAGEVAQGLSRCFGGEYRVETGECAAWNPEQPPDGLQTGGVIVCLQIEETAVLGLFPESIPLPVWIRSADDSQKSRLQTLAFEFGPAVLPLEFECEKTSTATVDSLPKAVDAAAAADTAQLLTLNIHQAADDAEAPAEPNASAFLLWPVNQPQRLAEFDVLSSPPEVVPPTSAEAETPPPDEVPASAPQPSVAQQQPPTPMPVAALDEPPQYGSRMQRLIHLPVTVSVSLAEKEVGMEQVMSIMPGSLITFNKSCEELLDLYVNNHLYARGEAVKIGEKFGLRLTDVGIRPERRSQLLES